VEVVVRDVVELKVCVDVEDTVEVVVVDVEDIEDIVVDVGFVVVVVLEAVVAVVVEVEVAVVVAVTVLAPPNPINATTLTPATTIMTAIAIATSCIEIALNLFDIFSLII